MCIQFRILFSVESRQAWPNYHFACTTNEDRFPCFLHVKLSWCMIYIDVPAKTTFDRWNLYYVKRLKKGKTWLVFTIGWFLSWPYSYYNTISFHINYTGIFYWKWNRIFSEICFDNKFIYVCVEHKLEKLLDVILHETNVYDITCTFQGYNGIEWTLNRILN